MRLILLFLLIPILLGCGFVSNEKPAEYIKSLVAYKEGSDGLFIYFILADSSGEMTINEGEVSMIIVATHYDHPEELLLFKQEFPARKDHFHRGKIGIGPFERNVTACSLGRIPYNNFRYDMEKIISDHWRGKIKLEFKTSSKILKSEETLYF